ncbi:hypothetical protein Clacol_005543 [Clathrus columnatus]|uniref:Uncharacterized protein n=1 Tax=Clathrus columnatus TaxID=1419009 RepID=A0AAV5A9M2_9AGAM|nr:hypothetical protein Clacol_005543 [Clathrus columnatus]
MASQPSNELRSRKHDRRVTKDPKDTCSAVVAQMLGLSKCFSNRVPISFGKEKEMAFIAAQGLFSFVTFRRGDHLTWIPRLKPAVIPRSTWLMQVLLMFGMSLLNNWSFSYKVPLTVQIIVRSSGLAVSMLFGYFMMGKTYSFPQLIAVIVVTAGVILATLSGPSTSTNSYNPSDIRQYAIGISMLILASIITGYYGTLQERTYTRHGPHWREGVFYTHGFSSLSISNHNTFGGVSYSYIYLVLNLVTQFLCTSSVNKLSTAVSSVSTNLALTARKALSLCISVWWFNNPWDMRLSIGAIEGKPATSPSDGPQTGSGQTGPSSGSTNKPPANGNSVGSTPPSSVPAKPSNPSVQSPPTPPNHSSAAIPPSQTPSNNSPPKNSPITPSTRPSDPSGMPNKPSLAPSAAPTKSSPTSTQSTPSNTNNDSGPGNAGDNGSKQETPVQPTPPSSSSVNHQPSNTNGPDGNGSAKPNQGQSGSPSKPSISPPFGDPKGTGVRPPFPTKTSRPAGNNNPTSSIISQSGAVPSKSISNGEGVPTKTGDSPSPTFTLFDGPGEGPSGPTFGSSSSSGNTGFSSVLTKGPSPSQNSPGHQGGRPNSSSKGPPSVSSTTISNESSSFTPFNVPGPTSFPDSSGSLSTTSNQSPDHPGIPGFPSSIFNDPDRSSSFTPPPTSSFSQDKGHSTSAHGPGDPFSSILPTPRPIPSQSLTTFFHESSTPNPSPTRSVTQTDDGPNNPNLPFPSSIPSSGPTIANGPDHDPSSTQETKPSSIPSDPSKGGNDDPITKPPVSPSSSQNQSGNDTKPTPTDNNPESAENGPKPTNIAPSQPPSPPKNPVETIVSTRIPGDNGPTLTQTQAQSASFTPSSSSLTFSAPPPISPSLSSTASLPPIRAASSAPPGSLNSMSLGTPLEVLQSQATDTSSTETPSLTTIISTRSRTTSVGLTTVPTTVFSGPTPIVTSFPSTVTVVFPFSAITFVSTLASMPTPDSGAAASSGSSHTGPIVGAFVGAVIAALILAAISFYIIRRKRRNGPIILQDDMAFTGEGAGVSVPPPLPPAGGLFNASETPYSPVSTTENENNHNRRSETNEDTGGRDYQRVLVQSPSMESLRESLMGITRLSPVPQLLLGDPFGDHSRMDDSDDDRSTFRGGSSVGHGSAHSIRSSPSIRSNHSTASTVRIKRTFRTIAASPTPLEDNNPFADNNNVLIDHPGPSSAEFINDPFADDLLGQANNMSESDHFSAESTDTPQRYISRLSAGSAITNLSYEPSEDGTVGYAL